MMTKRKVLEELRGCIEDNENPGNSSLHMEDIISALWQVLDYECCFTCRSCVSVDDGIKPCFVIVNGMGDQDIKHMKPTTCLYPENEKKPHWESYFEYDFKDRNP